MKGNALKSEKSEKIVTKNQQAFGIHIIFSGDVEFVNHIHKDDKKETQVI